MILAAVVLLWVLAAVLPYRLLSWRQATQTRAQVFVAGIMAIPTLLYASLGYIAGLFSGICSDVCGSDSDLQRRLAQEHVISQNISAHLPPVIAITCALVALSLYLHRRFPAQTPDARIAAYVARRIPAEGGTP